jgi:hypothetical protein
LVRYDDDEDEGQGAMTLDDLLGPVPETDASDSQSDYIANLNDYSPATSSAVSDKNLSKSQRVRNFLEAQPEARNRDVVEALAEYGVTAADVSNAKAQLKRKGDSNPKRGRPAASTSAAAPAATATKSQAGLVAAAAGGSIGMHEIEAALTFVREMGSLDRAKQLLVIIQQIQQL